VDIPEFDQGDGYFATDSHRCFWFGTGTAEREIRTKRLGAH